MRTGRRGEFDRVALNHKIQQEKWKFPFLLYFSITHLGYWTTQAGTRGGCYLCHPSLHHWIEVVIYTYTYFMMTRCRCRGFKDLLKTIGSIQFWMHGCFSNACHWWFCSGSLLRNINASLLLLLLLLLSLLVLILLLPLLLLIAYYCANLVKQVIQVKNIFINGMLIFSAHIMFVNKI